jgi:5-dehydro-4-deoxyglucarate dehydratase
MAPDVANAFYRAYREDDLDLQRRLQDAFYTPLTVLRDSTPGYAISLIKAGLRLSGVPVGGVRPPLSDPSPEHLARLEEILAAGRSAVASRPAMVIA